MEVADTVVKVKSISNTKLAIATAFLGLSAIAAATVGSLAGSSDCFKNNKCVSLYKSCVDLECKSNLPDVLCKHQCLYDAIQETSMYKPAILCGNRVIEQGEICDDTSGYCLQDCTIKVHSVSSGEKYSNIGDINFIVTNQYGDAIKNAHIKMYPYNKNNPSYFPLEDFTTDLQLEGYTDLQGVMSLPFDVIKSLSGILQIIVEKDRYLGAIWHSAGLNNIIQSGQDVSFILNKIQDEPTSQKLAPVFVVSDVKFRPYIERVNRSASHVVMPVVREHLMDGVAQVDLAMHIVGLRDQWKTFEGNPVKSKNFVVIPTEGSKEAHLVLKKENIQIGKHYSFDVKLEYPGMYYSFFEFTLYNEEGDLQTYYYFPKAKNLKDEFPEWVTSLMNENGYDVYPESLFVENTRFAVFDNPTEDVSFNEIIPGHNQSDDSRINVVFFGTGFEQQDFVEAAKFATINEYLSLTSVHPFVDNKDSFNYWYYPSILSPEQATWSFGDTSSILFGSKTLTFIQELMTKHALNGKTVLILLVNDETLLPGMKTAAASGKCKFQRGITLAINKNLFIEYRKTKTFEQTFLDLDLGRVVLHEFGHEIGLLGEEYYNSQNLFDNAIYEKEHVVTYNPALRPNSYYAFRDYAKECYKLKFSFPLNIGAYTFGLSDGDIICKPGTAESCQNAPWSDIMGNGCGLDGVVDCSFSDPDFYKEIACHSGGGQGGGTNSLPDLFKPTFFSIMEFGGKFNAFYSNDKHPYGLFNERVICDDIEMYTGKKCID